MSAKAQAQRKSSAPANGNGTVDPALTAAFAGELKIAQEAEQIRGQAKELTPDLFMKLWPLLQRPIPDAFIQTVGVTRGKPYASTGIRSVQVQVDRMNNVLTPLWWRDEVNYREDGRVATVEVQVGNPGSAPLIVRHSAGGVDQGSTAGNIHKGSYTNAAKLAFARLGVGHEVYLGATDLDPDVSRDLAEQAKGNAEPAGVGREIAKKMVDKAWGIAKAKSQLQLAASHTAGEDVGDCSTKAKAITALSKLSFEQAERVDNWIARKAEENGDGS